MNTSPCRSHARRCRSWRRTLVCWTLVAGASPLASGCASSVGTPRVIYIARHGQTDWNRVTRLQGDPDLDPVGYINRASLWMLLRDEPLHEIYTSAMRRTQRTAELIARQKKLKIRVRPEINEIGEGVLVGMCLAHLMPERVAKRPSARRCLVDVRGSRIGVTLPELRRITAAWFATKSLTARPPLGESYEDLLRRSKPFVAQLQRRGRDTRVLVVGHGVINRVLLHQLTGWSMPSVQRLRQENDQVYRIEDAGTDEQRVFLYTPGVGWKRCAAPRPGKQLDCNPGPSYSAAGAHVPAAGTTAPEATPPAAAPPPPAAAPPPAAPPPPEGT